MPEPEAAKSETKPETKPGNRDTIAMPSAFPVFQVFLWLRPR
jgi:hypothetical protein